MQYRKLKIQQGFTLVEVIVVAVIVAILAGVSIPLYMGYINESRDNAAANAAGSAASFAAACVNGGKDIVLDATGITGDENGTKALTCTGSEAKLVIPNNITIKLSGTNAIIGVHKLSKSAKPESQPFTFRTDDAVAAPAPETPAE